MQAMKVFLAFVAVSLVAATVSAQDSEGHKGHRGGMRSDSPIDRILALADLKLTDDQVTKLKAIKTEYAPKFQELATARDGILTDDQKKARAEAMKEAKAAGKKGRELFEAVQAAVKLTDEQKTKMKEVGKEAAALGKEVLGKAKEVLTADQQDILKKAFGHHAHGGQ
jgi:Spy/CpxP family protein refolding chaperone